MEHLIYILIDPKDNFIRYVGQTTKTLKNRLNSHINKAKSSPNKTTHKNTWIKSLLNQDLKPIIKLIDTVSENEWKEKEKFYIKKYKELGENLLNISEGGDSGSMPGGKRIWGSVEKYENWKRKISETLKKRVISDEERKIKAEICRKTHLGKKRNENTKLKLSINKIGDKNPMFGKKLSDERKKQISEFSKGKKLSIEVRKKISDSKLKKPVVQKDKDGNIIKIYSSLWEIKTTTNFKNVNKVLKGLMKHCGGFKWEYYYDN
jgi:group I intron endonuclease